MAAEAVGPAAGREVSPAKQKYVPWSAALGETILARIGAGEFLHVICRERTMPSPEAVMMWAKATPEFGARLEAARRAGPRPPGTSTYSAGMAQEIFQRVCEGEALTRIGDDPTMPSTSTIFLWRRDLAEFETLMQLGMRIRGERFVDRAEDLAEGATPETAYLTQVRLTHLRWSAGVMAPRVFRPRLVEPEAPRTVQTLLFRHFKIEEDPETGKRKVVAYCPNPITGQVEREDTPGWRQAGDANTCSLPGGRKTGQGYWADGKD